MVEIFNNTKTEQLINRYPSDLNYTLSTRHSEIANTLSARPTAVGVITDFEGKILLVKSSKHGIIFAPQGGLKEGMNESIEEALYRELSQEAWIDPEDVELEELCYFSVIGNGEGHRNRGGFNKKAYFYVKGEYNASGLTTLLEENDENEEVLWIERAKLVEFLNTNGLRPLHDCDREEIGSPLTKAQLKNHELFSIAVSNYLERSWIKDTLDTNRSNNINNRVLKIFRTPKGEIYYATEELSVAEDSCKHYARVKTENQNKQPSINNAYFVTITDVQNTDEINGSILDIEKDYRDDLNEIINAALQINSSKIITNV